MAQDQSDPPRPPPRSSSPAKRLHSDMDNKDQHMDLDVPAGPRATKPLPARATSVEMADATPTGSSATSSEAASLANTDSTASSLPEIPTLDQQVAKVLSLHKQPLSDRQEGYVISEKWLERVFARTSENKDRPEQFDKSATQGEIGPVDNSDLVDHSALADDLMDQNGDDFIPLRPGLQIQHNFEILPAEAWELIISWYGLKDGSPVIRRYVHNTAVDETGENLQYEVYPPIFTIRRVRKSPAVQASDTSKLSPRLVASRSDGYMEFLKAAKKAAGIELKNKVRVWRVLNAPTATDEAPQQSGMLTPESSPRNGSPVSAPRQGPLPLAMDVASFNRMEEGTEREQVTGKDETANEKYNGHMNLATAGLAEDQILILEEQDDKGDYISTTKAASKNQTKAGTKSNKGIQSAATSGRSTPTLAGPMTRGRTRTGRTRGTVGLTNLGNTCYMNSALQCIRSVEELSVYFLQGKYKPEINSDNPLGHGGSIAKSYAGLLASIYDENGVSSFSPKNFKFALGRAQPMFSGYGQQDSQEFLSFLVDGLHEDLNRIKKKPYTENPESDDNTVNDPEKIKELGEKFRAIHHSRNDSVAMDLFNGFYKNTMVCPDCNKVSITFDPYSLVTLQLPIEQTWQHVVRFVPLRGKIYDVEVDIDKNASIKTLKEYVGKRFGVEGKRIMASEVYNHKFYRHLDDDNTVAESNIGQRDDVYFYELEEVPTNWPPPKKKSSKYRSMVFASASSDEDIPDSSLPQHDRVIVPVFHRAPSTSTYRSNQWSMALWPSYILVNRDEAKDYDAILKKVLVKVAQMTTRDIFDDNSTLSQSQTGSDVVVTTEEDASPNGDPRVHDGSVEGEDMVEVTMTEAAATPVAQSAHEDSLPQVLRPGTFVPPEYRQLFEMKHTRRSKEWVTTGWSTVDNNKTLPPISKRIRTAPSRQSSVLSLDAASNASSSEETDDIPQFSADAQSSIDVANESSDEEMQSIETPAPEFTRGGRQKKSKKNRKQDKKHKHNKNLKTYSKKGKDRVPDQPLHSFSDPEDEDDTSLIRMGETIVLEWSTDAYDALFGGSSVDDARGMETSNFVDRFEDPELQAKKAKRAARRKNGITLEECFAETSKSEVLSEDNAWYCNKCKELRRATKTLEIWTAPDILVLHLKRFASHRSFRDKIEALVDFPIEGLDLSGKVGLPEGKDLVYDLFAVDNHYGGLGGGHYTAFAQNFFDKEWYDYNDSSVRKLNDPKSVVTTAAYLLFYRRRSSGPLGPEYLKDIVNTARHPDSDEADEEEEEEETTSRNPSRSPAGNGLRLGGSSLNGSSRDSGAGAGQGALRGGGSASAGNLLLRGAEAETVDEMEMPPDYDEGYAEDNYTGVSLPGVYAPLNQGYTSNWSFDNIGNKGSDDETFDDAASDAPNAGSQAGDDLQSRILEDFGDDLNTGIKPGVSTPLEEEVPALLPGDGSDTDVVDIHVKAD